MNQPIPRGGTEPLKVGDRVQIVPEWQDPGDERFERFVIEAPPNSTQVRIRTIIPGLVFHPTEWIEADHLILIPTDNQQPPTS
ncbi:MAG: hypothetical protein EAZ84_13840 [Verrucomicrobia bacterium]|nr:MAG: hypothetical protein EAZ84_13840 [Verrucomicrobiota bacterium]